MELGHLPVMPVEVLGTLAPAPGSLQIDATVGGGGHTERILEAANPDGRVLGLDADAAAIDRVARAAWPRFGDRLVLRQANFRELGDGRARRRASRPSTARCSTSACRASSSPTASAASASGPAARSTCASTRRRGVPASELLATLDADELAALFRRYGEEPSAWRIAKAIVAARQTAPIETAEDLAALVERVAPGEPAPAPAHPPRHPRVPGAPDRGQRGARRAPEGLAAAVDLLRPGGRLVVLSYHSLEDRIVKRFFAAERRGCICPPEAPVCVCGRSPRLRLVTRPSMTPTGRESTPTPEPGARACAPPSGSPPERARHRPTRSRPDTPTVRRPVDPSGPMPAPRLTEEESREQAPPVQPSQELRPPPARAARAEPARPRAGGRRAAASTTSRRRR